MDRDVGKMLSLLKECGIDENTVVFFCSDNGAANRYDHLFKSSGVLRGRKRDMTEGGIRTPMVVRWPGEIAAGRENDSPWSFADFLVTAADLAGAEVSGPTDGVSVVPTLKGQSQLELRDRMLYWEFFENGFKQAARRGEWKVIRSAPGAALELYHLGEDPGEGRDLAKEHPDVIQDFQRDLAVARRPSKEWPSPVDD